MRIARLGLVALLPALVACAGSSSEDIPVDPLYEPPETLPLHIGLRSDNSLPSQMFGRPVIRDLQEMRLFENVVSPYDARVRMDAKLRLFIERVETDQLDEFVLGLVDAGKPIRGAFAKPDPILSTRVPAGASFGSGRLGTIGAASPSQVKAHARVLSNALARKIWESRDALIAHVKAQSE